MDLKQHLAGTHFVGDEFIPALNAAIEEFIEYRPESLITMPLGITKTAREIVRDFHLGSFIPVEIFCDQDYNMGVRSSDARMIHCG